MGKKAQSKSEAKNYERQRQFIMNALRELSPQNIQALSQMFLPQLQAQAFAGGQTAIAGLKRSQARRGLGGSNIALTQEAGLRANLLNNVLAQAFQGGVGLAGQRAGLWSQTPSQTAPNYNMANAFAQAAQQGLLAYALQNKPANSPVNVYNQIPTNTQFGYPFNPSAQSPLVY